VSQRTKRLWTLLKNQLKMKKNVTVTGTDLKNLGFPPAKWYREALEHINKNN
jgi:hypothetical protein